MKKIIEYILTKIKILFIDKKYNDKLYKIFNDILKTEMIFVNGCTFTMHNTVKKISVNEDEESTTYKVNLNDYYISKYLVTQGLWKKVMRYNPCYFKDCSDDCPVVKVDWNDCQKFIKKLNELTGKNYRLPSALELEYAVKGGRKFNSETKIAVIKKIVWLNLLQNCINFFKNKMDIESKSNDLGLYDMNGNIFEWCSDFYEKNEFFFNANSITNLRHVDRIIFGLSLFKIRDNHFFYRIKCNSDFRSFQLGFRLVSS